MATLGFRHAQFSEDLAWLPDWLQHNQIESPEEELQEKTAGYLEDNDEGNDVDKAKEGNNICHLYWSGEGSSQASLTQPPGNVLRFHLHFSAHGNSSCRGSQIASTSELLVHQLPNVEPASEPVEIDRSMQCGDRANVTDIKEDAQELVVVDGGRRHAETVKVSDIKEAKAESVEIDRKRQDEERLIVSKNLREAATEFVEIDGATQCEQKLKISKPKEGETSDLVELLIAASEALVINESVESDSALRCLPMISVVEMALRVKQARLEGLENLAHGTISSTGEDCFPGELDDISIMDDLEDLGVSVNDHNDLDVSDLDISHVEETPFSKNHDGYDHASECLLENICDRNLSDNVFAHDGGLTKYFSLEVAEENPNHQNSISVDPAPCPSIVDMPSHVAKIPHVSVCRILNISTEDKRKGFAAAGWNLCQPQCDDNLSSQEQDIRNYTSGRFQSRWFGGWTEKEIDAAAPLKPQTNRSIAKPFIREMSFLSESADIVPDENSVIQEREIGRIDIASQSSKPPGQSCEKPDQGRPFSQEVARSLSLSSLDPLCSFVPCSLSVENPGSPQAQRRVDKDIDAEKCSSPISGPQLVKSCRTSNLDPWIQHNHHKDLSPTADEECSDAVVQRRLSTLKNYSKILPSGMNGLENWQLSSSSLSQRESKRRTASLKIEMDANKPSGWELPGLSSLKSTPKGPAVQYNDKNHGSSTGEPTGEAATNKTILDKFKRVTQVLPPLPAKRKLPHILNRKQRCRIQADDSFSKDKQSVETETTVSIQESDIFHKMQCHIHNPIVDRAPQEKKVRFAEAEIPQLRVDRSAQRIKSSRRNFTQLRKRTKCCKQQLTAGRQLLIRCINDRKIFIFQGIDFLVTGFSSNKEREIEGLIQRHGGNVLSDIPTRSSAVRAQQPIVIASKKLRTAKFLYGCAVKALILEVSWLTDSVSSGSIKSPEKHMIISYQADVTTSNITGETYPSSNSRFTFENVGIVLHGKSSFFTKFATIIKHAGGRAFSTLQQLLESLNTKKVSIGIIATEFESAISRHLRHCAVERNIPVMTVCWIVESLYAGKLLPLSG